MICFYHSTDADGWCSAKLVYDYYKSKGGYLLTRDNFIGMNYSNPIDFSIIRDGEDVWIVDYSLSKDEDKFNLNELARKGKNNIYWIDHHTDSIDIDFEKYPYLTDNYIKGVRHINEHLSAAKLVYLYTQDLINNTNNIHDIISKYENADYDEIEDLDESIPLSILYVSDHDTFLHRFEYSIPFQSSIRYYLFNIDRDVIDYDILTTDDEELLDEYLDIGIVLENNNRMNNKQIAKNKSFTAYIDKYRCLAINTTGNSLIFRDYELKNYSSALILFHFNGKQWVYSLFNPGDDCLVTPIDCGKVARLLGGGGRPQAAGFSSDNLLIVKREGEICHRLELPVPEGSVNLELEE